MQKCKIAKVMKYKLRKTLVQKWLRKVV